MNQTQIEFLHTVDDLIASEPVRRMGNWNHHGSVTCLDHSLFVSYLSFRIARKLHIDVRAATRAGLLHDLYLYDPKDSSAHPGSQCFDHPVAAAHNAAALTHLSKKEKNIILSHMWPLSKTMPHSLEAVLVNVVDTACATLELTHLYRPARLRRQLGLSTPNFSETPQTVHL